MRKDSYVHRKNITEYFYIVFADKCLLHVDSITSYQMVTVIKLFFCLLKYDLLRKKRNIYKNDAGIDFFSCFNNIVSSKINLNS